MRKVYILPNLFTAGSLFSGMLAIFYVFNGDPRLIIAACWLVLLSAFLDVADGMIARLTRTQSSFGLQFDSLSDLVAFGVAPALLAYETIGDRMPSAAAITVCAFFVICGALRLARFNVQATREESKAFLGLPIPGAGMAAMAIAWVFTTNPVLHEYLRVELILSPLMVLLAGLMVSKVPYLGFKSINLADRQPFEILVTIVVVGILLFLLKQHLSVVLLVGIWSYIILGLVALPYRRTVRRRLERLAARDHDPRSGL